MLLLFSDGRASARRRPARQIPRALHRLGGFNRAVFLEEILNFIAGFGATAAELSAIRTAVQTRTKQLAKRPQRGRPRACAAKPVQTNRSGADIDVGMKRADNWCLAQKPHL